ncbi:MAG: archaetidylserine decarboxylase [Gemmataceae bacterium]|nr:archaetidylserine decarboxylase [Gemmataceae bacterium]
MTPTEVMPTAMPPADMIRREQFRQAKQVHGGLWNFLVAVLGVKLARLPLPTRRLRASIYRTVFGKKYPPGINEDEAEQPLASYPSLNAVFTRGIRPEYRPIADTPAQFLCPCDGAVQDLGRLDRDRLLTLKGIEYTLAALLPGVDTRPYEHGHYAIIFLSPIDCHRVFSPQDGELVEAIHVPGHRLPVHPPCQRAEYPVYALNERMILRLATGLGPCVVVMIAGWGVGNITLPAAPDFRPRRKRLTRKTWPAPLAIRRGEWIATFELGSTAVLITPPSAEATSLVSKDQKVKYGQPAFAYPG